MQRFARGVASTVHRIVFGSIEGVNRVALIDPPSEQTPAWPVATVEGERPMRPTRCFSPASGYLMPVGECFRVRGYHESRVDDIVAEAGLSHGSFYRYFKNKDELFSVIAFEAADQMVSLIERFPSDPADSLDDWLTDWFETYRSEGGVLSAWEEIAFNIPDLMERSTEMTQVFIDRLQRVVCGRGFGDVSVDALVLLAVIEHGPHSVFVLDRLEESEAIATVGYIIRIGVLGRRKPQ